MEDIIDEEWMPVDDNEGEEQLYEASKRNIEKHIIISESILIYLLSKCSFCKHQTLLEIVVTKGSVFSCNRSNNGGTERWSSQKYLNHMPTINLALSSGILLSGASPKKVILSFRHAQ